MIFMKMQIMYFMNKKIAKKYLIKYCQRILLILVPCNKNNKNGNFYNSLSRQTNLDNIKTIQISGIL